MKKASVFFAVLLLCCICAGCLPQRTELPEGASSSVPASSEGIHTQATAAQTEPEAFGTTAPPQTETTLPPLPETEPVQKPDGSAGFTVSIAYDPPTTRPENLPPKDEAFFDDAVFIGDSVTLGLKNYVTGQRNKGRTCLGNAQFLCCGNLSYANAVQPVSAQSVHPAYKGEKMSVEDGIRKCGVKKALIMLGMNDFAAYSKSACAQNIATLFDRIEEKNPDVDIYIESITPMLAEKEHGKFCNANMRAFNDDMRAICAERGYPFIDISGAVMADENGCLKKEYCGDAPALGLHMSPEGSAAWANYLTDLFCTEA